MKVHVQGLPAEDKTKLKELVKPPVAAAARVSKDAVEVSLAPAQGSIVATAKVFLNSLLDCVLWRRELFSRRESHLRPKKSLGVTSA